MKLIKSKQGEKFEFGIFAIFLAIAISSFAFISEDNKITGFAVLDNPDYMINPVKLTEFKDINSLGSLAPGNYYVDENGIVYLMDDNSRIAMTKVNLLDESQKNRKIYIDIEGRIGYILGTNEK